MSVIEQMKKFMEPESVALFGVSRRNEHGFNILQHILSYGYQGRIYPVNPNASEIMGVKTYPSAKNINAEIDLAVINLPRDLVPGIVKECVEVGIKQIVIATQGFSDANDEEGKRLQKEINGFIKKDGVRILGPNSLGTANPYINFSSSFIKLNMLKVPVGIICQSGSFFGFHELSTLGKGIDLANSCDVDFIDSLEYFDQDPQTKVIVLHIEGMRNAKEFIKTVSRVARKKPVLALKTGRTEQAARAAQSHTGSLAGSDAVWDAALRQAGVIRVTCPNELSDLSMAFSILPPMKGRRIGIITGSGGLGVITIDSCSQANLEVASLSPATVERMRALFPSWQSIGNPLDILPAFVVSKQPFYKVLTEALDASFKDDGIDAISLMWGIWTRPECNRFCQTINELLEVHCHKPLVCFLMGDYAGEAKDILLAAGKTMVFHNPDRAARALAHLAQYSAFRRSL